MTIISTNSTRNPSPVYLLFGRDLAEEDIIINYDT